MPKIERESRIKQPLVREKIKEFRKSWRRGGKRMEEVTPRLTESVRGSG